MSAKVHDFEPYAMTKQELSQHFEVDLSKGLTYEQAKQIRSRHGKNELDKIQPDSIWDRVKEQFQDFFVRILLIAAIVSYIIAVFQPQDKHSIPAWVEPLVIFIMLVGNAIIGIYQDYDAEKALEALQSIQASYSTVLRDEKWQTISSKELVSGDVVRLSQGNKVPADIRLIKLDTLSFHVDQSLLTGESIQNQKHSRPLKNLESFDLHKFHNAVFSGTLVSFGIAVGVVTKIGMETQMGQICEQLKEAKAEGKVSPLKQKLLDFGDSLTKIIVCLCFMVWIVNYKNIFNAKFSNPLLGALSYFKIAVALAVAAIPEGLPAVITTCLALGTRKMAKKNAIIRKLSSVETLGCTTVICTDKTGTLTTNQMVVQKLCFCGPTQNDLITTEVEGTSYEPNGKITYLDKPAYEFSQQKNLHKLAEAVTLNNLSDICSVDNVIKCKGMPTEGALRTLVEKIGFYDRKHNHDLTISSYKNQIMNQWDQKAVLMFTSARKAMSVLMRHNQQSENTLFLKGAAEKLIDSSGYVLTQTGEVQLLTEKIKEKWHKKVKDYARKGLRCLAVCYKEDLGLLGEYQGDEDDGQDMLQDIRTYDEVESNSILIAVVGIRDPPRPLVKNSIKHCEQSGMFVIMITGDNKTTAEAIAYQVGILHSQDVDLERRSFTTAEFNQLDPYEQQQVIRTAIKTRHGLVFSRADPIMKRHLIKLLSNEDQVVAMTGDGTNDAPALKQAHIGISMGLTGTDVAKEASDMILVDDNFATIVAAVEEGRSIYANMKAFIRYMISSNFGEVISIFVQSVLGLPDGFSSLQLLWVNLVTDGLPAIALSFNPCDSDVMKAPPRSPKENIVDKWTFIRYITIGSYIGFATIGVFVYWYVYYVDSGDGHTLVTYSQLSNWSDCSNWESFTANNFNHYDFSENPCLYFSWGKEKASSMSLTVLVMIEMFNALNALSETESLFNIGLSTNPYLIIAIFTSVGWHCLILYVPFLARIFGTQPLSYNEWTIVMLFALPVIAIEEILKLYHRSVLHHKKKRE